MFLFVIFQTMFYLEFRLHIGFKYHKSCLILGFVLAEPGLPSGSWNHEKFLKIKLF